MVCREDLASKPLKGPEVADAGLDGSGEIFTERLADVVCGGQVVLSETTWSAIQDQIPGQSQASTRSCPYVDWSIFRSMIPSPPAICLLESFKHF